MVRNGTYIVMFENEISIPLDDYVSVFRTEVVALTYGIHKLRMKSAKENLFVELECNIDATHSNAVQLVWIKEHNGNVGNIKAYSIERQGSCITFHEPEPLMTLSNNMETTSLKYKY